MMEAVGEGLPARSPQIVMFGSLDTVLNESLSKLPDIDPVRKH